jgi:hypothetical protein
LLAGVPGVCEVLRHLVGVALVPDVDEPRYFRGFFSFGGLFKLRLFRRKSGLFSHKGSLVYDLQLGIEVSREGTQGHDGVDGCEGALGREGPIPYFGTTLLQHGFQAGLNEVVDEGLDTAGKIGH